MYAILGVTGNTGAVVAQELLAAGEAVRVVVRRAEAGEAWRARGAEVAVAALDDEDALAAAFAGARGAYLLSPPDFTTTDHAGTACARIGRAARAARRAGVAHLVYLSSVGAQHEAGTGPIRATHAAERAILEAGVPATFIRAAYFQENWASVLGMAAEQGVLPTFLQADTAIPMVATRDIGVAAARALRDPNTAKAPRVVSLAGPVDLSPRDVAAALGELLGKPVTAHEAPLEAAEPTFVGMGMPPYFAGLFRELLAGIRSGHVAWEPGADVTRGAVPIAATLGSLLARA